MVGYIGSKSSVTLVDGYSEAEADAEFVTKTGDTMSGDLSFGDDDKAIFGAGSDLQIYHDGSNSYIDDTASGSLVIRGSTVYLQKYTGEYMLDAVADGAVTLYHNNAAKLATTSTGVTVTQSGTDVGLLVTGGSYNYTAKFESSDAEANIIIEDSNSTNNGNMIGVATNDMYFLTNGSERMRIEDNGDVKIGNGISTSVIGIVSANNDTSKQGVSFRETGYIAASRINDTVMYLNRMTSSASDGQIVSFRTNGTEQGSIGRGGSGFFIAGIASTDFGVVFDGSGILPSTGAGVLRDNQDNLGHASYRWEDAFITNGATTGSDANDKQDVATLTDTEMLVAARLSQTFRTYRWKDAVVSKGNSARTHTGTIAQEVQAAFTAEGLDAGDYAMFMSDTWWEHDVDVPAVEAVAEVTDEDGNVTTEAVEAVDAYTRTDNYDTEAEAPEGATSKTRLGIRYPELLSFVAAYNEQRFASIEARLTALEDV